MYVEFCASIQARDYIAQTYREHRKLHHLMEEAGDTEKRMLT